LLFDTIWPPRCALCERLLPERSEARRAVGELPLLHEACFSALPLCRADAAQPRRLRDGAPLLACYADDAGLFRLLHAAKYGGRSKLLLPLAERLAQRALAAGWLGEGGILVPLPDDARRRRERGFSVTGILAAELARHSGLSVRSDLLARRSGGVAQAGLAAAAARRDNQAERWVSGRIDAVASEVPLFLVEDQITTGATASAALRRLGARGNPVACIALAIAEAAPTAVVA
jgi:predicted amidophosphoribosyltransferase